MQPHQDTPQTTSPQGGTPRSSERGQALVEYALIAILVALVAGIALAATGPALGNVFSNSISDLLRQTELRTPIPGREEFWETVTAVFNNPAVERPLPTNTVAPPTTQPTAGPSPTATPITPTPTPSDTPTPTLTPTPKDIIHDAEFYDSVEPTNAVWWRTDANINTSGSPWTSTYYNNAGIAPANVITQLKGQPFGAIDYKGTATEGWGVPNVPATNFWMVAERDLQLAEQTTLTIRMLADDQAVVKVDGAIVNGLNATGSDGKTWYVGTITLTGSGLNDPAVTPAAPTIRHRVRVEYRQGTGNSRLYVSIQSSKANPDDTRVDGGGSPVATGDFACGWGQTFRADGNDANTKLGMFDEFVNSEMPANSRCHLELRGAINVPATYVNPQLVFYDVWDLKNANAAIEIANYIQATAPAGGTPAPVPSADRSQLKWGRINLHTANTRNYNYTRNAINLKDVKLSDGSALDLTKPVTMRFVITSVGAGTPNRWYIDDIWLGDAGPQKVFYLNQPTWNLNDEAQMDDFIFTGGESTAGVYSGWRLQSHNKFGPSGMAFHDSHSTTDTDAGVATDGAERTQYTAFSEANAGSTDPLDFRLHTLEFNGWISFVDVNGNPIPADAAGNRGDPVIEFYQGIDVGGRTGLEVQYKTEAAGSQWTTLPNGLIRDVTATNTVVNPTMRLVSVSMKDLTGNPNRIRVRFVMKVPGNSVRRDGWWIDEIRIGRAESPKWVDYPYTDDAQYFIAGPWNFTGSWGKTDITGRRNDNEPLVNGAPDPTYKRASYSSSPGGTYIAGSGKTAMELRYAWDVFNDTQLDAAQSKQIWGRPIPDPQNAVNTGGAAVAPMLTFYHWRDLGAPDSFTVEWKRLDEAQTAWKPLWYYNSGNGTTPNVTNLDTRQQTAWEFVEIDLGLLLKDVTAANNAANRRDDDVVFRFVLNATGATARPGIYIDDINIRERYNRNAAPIAFNLWPKTENRNNPATGTAIGVGHGASLFDDPDASTTNRIWSQSWFAGADWFPQTWGGGARLGLYGFHDSPVGGQNQAPDGIDNFIGQPGWAVPAESFRVLELNNVIDLRAVDVQNEAPMLYWWQRYHLGGGNIAMVQISTELTGNNGVVLTDAQKDADIKARCGNQNVYQCYEQNRGWSTWTTVWSLQANTNSELRSYGWTRGQVDLTPYAYRNNPLQYGKRIRVRFVLNSLATNTNWQRDGWYIDQVEFGYSKPVDTVIIRESGYTYDPSQRGLTAGFYAEGIWGLDAAVVEGSTGSAVTFGTWNARWWNCTTCANLAGGNYANGTNIFMNDPNRRAPDFQNTVVGINYNFGNGKPAGSPASFPTDKFVGELVLDTPVIGVTPGFPAGNRTFQVTSDDGVRVKYQQLDANGLPQGPDPGWNIIDNWRSQSPTTAAGALTLLYGARYRITIQYFEDSGGATLLAQIGSGAFSFSDSPKQGGATAIDRYPIPYGNTSLVGKQVLDLRGLPTNSLVVMSFKTKYRLGNKSAALVEVSQNGGFTWEQTDLTLDEAGFAFSSPTITNGVVNPSSNITAWQTRYHNLKAFKEKQILLRFRLDRSGEYCLRTAKDGNDSNPLQCGLSGAASPLEAINGYFDGWWISRIDISVQ
jgi:Flp pilus assembly pilin Flp